MYDDSFYNVHSNFKVIKKNNKGNSLVIVVVIIIVLILSYFLIFKDLLKNKNVKMENKMVSAAKEYVSRNSINTSKEIYLDISKLNVTLDNNCSLTSGVIYDGKSYTPNLVCQDYQSRVIKTNSDVSNYIRLKGEEVVILVKGITYYEPGYESNDLVSIIGNIGSEEGIYNLFYKTVNSNNVAIRKVIIIDNQNIRNLFPIISLNGDEVVYMVSGDKYDELSVNAYDTIDGNISNQVTIDSDLDTYQPGEYRVSYTVMNSRGYRNTVTRTVIVLDRETDLTVYYTINPKNLTNENVLITLNISNEFNKIVYPNNEEGTSLTYEVSENGIYRFIIYDKYDRIIEKTVEIDNIDKTVPEGSCIATRYYNKTEVRVDINTPLEISSYEYIIDGVSTNSQTNNLVKSVIKPSQVKVIVRDVVNNTSELNCNFVDKLTREIVVNEKGKNCLEGMNCYYQHDYGDSVKYPYCSLDDKPGEENKSCRGIYHSGCSITAVSSAIASMGVRSKTGVFHTPYTVWEELYPVNHKTGRCNGGCSGWTAMKEAITNSGLSAQNKLSLNKNTISQVSDHLRLGYVAIVHAHAGVFSTGNGHYMVLLGIRDDGYVFVSDPSTKNGTEKGYDKGKKYYVDTWVPLTDLISGGVDEVMLVGPHGMF